MQNVVIGSNKGAVSAAIDHARNLGYKHVAWCTDLTGDADRIGETYSRLAELAARVWAGSSEESGQLREAVLALVRDDECAEKIVKACVLGEKFCFVAGGEPTVKVVGSGVGGRSQQVALRASLGMATSGVSSRPDAVSVLLCGGTDGQDGPTDAAGAFAHPLVVDSVDVAQSALRRNDSFGFFSQHHRKDDLLITGLTGTNVMDLHIFLCQFSHNSSSRL